MANKRTTILKTLFAVGAAASLATQVFGQASGSAESQARIYMAMTGATNNVVDQLLGLDPVSHMRPRNYTNPMKGVSTYLLYDPRMNSDMTMAATFKIPMDDLWIAIYGASMPGPLKPKLRMPVHFSNSMTNFVPATPTTPATSTNVISLSGVVGTISSIAGISPALFAQTTAQSAVNGTTDADAFIAAQLARRFLTQTKCAVVDPVTIYAPSIFPLLTASAPNLSSLALRASGGSGTQYTPDNTDPMTEFSLLQGDVSYILKKQQRGILSAYTRFSLYTAPIAGTSSAIPPNVSAAYSTLVTDLKAAIAWLPPVVTGTVGSAPLTGVGSSVTALPYASIQDDIQQLSATLVKYKGLNDAQLYKSLRVAVKYLSADLPLAPDPDSKVAPDLSLGQVNLFDSTVQIAEALTTVGVTLATSVAPYGTVTSASPGAATPTTVANIVTRGWQIAKLLDTDSCKVLRVHLEMAQGTDKTTSYAIKWFKDSSAMVMLSFMVLDKPTDENFGDIGASSVSSHTDNIKLASWVMAYYPFQNADDALNLDGLQILTPDQFNPTITVKGRSKP
jgi:hypothetical protein